MPERVVWWERVIAAIQSLQGGSTDPLPLSSPRLLYRSTSANERVHNRTMADKAPESALEMERRHVRQGERLVAQQEAIVEQLGPLGDPLVVRRARELLATFRTTLALAQERLQSLERKFLEK